MTLAQVQAVVAVITALIGSWTALLIAVALTLPDSTGRAEAALKVRSKHCLGSGIGMAVLFALGIVAFTNPALRIFGLIALLTIGGVFVVGAAGLSKLMGARIAELSGQSGNAFGNLVKGSLVYSVALLFPLIGWYLFLPISLFYALGAGTLALWPRRKTAWPAQPQMDIPGVA